MLLVLIVSDCALLTVFLNWYTAVILEKMRSDISEHIWFVLEMKYGFLKLGKQTHLCHDIFLPACGSPAVSKELKERNSYRNSDHIEKVQYGSTCRRRSSNASSSKRPSKRGMLRLLPSSLKHPVLKRQRKRSKLFFFNIHEGILLGIIITWKLLGLASSDKINFMRYSCIKLSGSQLATIWIFIDLLQAFPVFDTVGYSISDCTQINPLLHERYNSGVREIRQTPLYLLFHALSIAYTAFFRVLYYSHFPTMTFYHTQSPLVPVTVIMWMTLPYFPPSSSKDRGIRT